MKKATLFLLLFFTSSLFASIGNISKLEGLVEIKRDGNTFKASINSEIEEKDIISTKENAMAIISLKDKTLITIGKNSSLDIQEYFYDENETSKSKAEFNFFKGAFKSVTGQVGKINPSKFKLKTKNATIGIRGTTVVADEDTVIVMEGSVYVLSQNKQVIVNEGYFSKTLLNKPPSQPREFSNKELDSIFSKLYPNKRVITFTTENTKGNKNKKTIKAQNGEVIVNEDGSITYLVDKSFKGTDIITILSNDDENEKIETIKVEIDVNGLIKLNLESVVIKDIENMNFDKVEQPTYVQNVQEDIQNIESAPTVPTPNQSPINNQTPVNNPISGISRFYLTNWQVPTTTNPINATLSGYGDFIGYNVPNDDIFIGTSGIDFSNIYNLSSIIENSGGMEYGLSSDPTTYYYVNDDYFGTYRALDATHNGWMQAVYDKYTPSGYTNSDNNASWGYWQQSLPTTGTLRGLWVSGTTISVNNFPTIVTYDFEGQMMGYAKANSNTTLHNIVMDSTNYINIHLDVGAGTTSGAYNFNTENSLNWSGTFIGSLTAGAFNTTFQTTSISPSLGSQEVENVITGAPLMANPVNTQSFIKGQTFGNNTNGILSVGGSFNLYNNTNTAFGVFIADKK